VSYPIGDNDLQQFVGLDGVRALESRFFRGGSFDPTQTASLLVEEALLCGAPEVEVRRDGEWFIVVSPFDWLTEDGTDVSADAFSRITSYRQGGDNSMRPEVLLAAFAGNVLTSRSGEVTVVKQTSAARPYEWPGSDRAGSRLVAFTK
jgi:hypothetical protein